MFVKPQHKAISQMSLHELPGEVIFLDNLMFDLEFWPALPESAAPEMRQADELEREALRRTITARWEEIRERIEEKGKSLHAWLSFLRDEAAAAREDLERRAVIVKAKERRLESVRAYVKTNMEALGCKRLEGVTWRLRVQGKGGVIPLSHDGATAVPVGLAEDVKVSPAFLVARLRELQIADASAPDICVLKEFLGYEPPLEPSSSLARQCIKEHGEVPDGFVLGERGTQLRIE